MKKTTANIAIGLGFLLPFLSKEEGSPSHLRFVPDLTPKDIVKNTILSNWPFEITGEQYFPNYTSPLKDAINIAETLQADHEGNISPAPYDPEKLSVQPPSGKQAWKFAYILENDDMMAALQADNKIRALLANEGITQVYTSLIERVDWNDPQTANHYYYRIEF